MTCDPTSVCIVGCGRWLRKDDQAGLLAARALQHDGLPATRVVLTEAPAADVLTCLDGLSCLIVIDAARSDHDHRPGTWHRIDFWNSRDRLQADAAGNVHSLSVAYALEIARQMNLLPGAVWIYAIAAEDCGYGEAPTPAVVEAIEAVVRQVRRDVRDLMPEQEAACA